jgi:hypothetical protein
MGTRFMCTVESCIHQNVKEAIVAGDELGTELIFRPLHNTSRVASNTVSREVVEILNRGGQFPDVKDLVAGVRGRRVYDGGRPRRGHLVRRHLDGLDQRHPDRRRSGVTHRRRGRGADHRAAGRPDRTFGTGKDPRVGPGPNMNAGPTKERFSVGLDSRLALRPPNEDCSRQTSADDCQRKQDFQLTVAHLFSLIVYGLLSLEQAALTAGLDRDVVDQIFDFQIRDLRAASRSGECI